LDEDDGAGLNSILAAAVVRQIVPQAAIVSVITIRPAVLAESAFVVPAAFTIV
jgi:hypothetical protein